MALLKNFASNDQTFQERGIRSGTVPTPLVVGLGEACRIAQLEMDYDMKHVTRLSQRLKAKIAEALEFVVVNGDTEHSYPGSYLKRSSPALILIK